MKVRFKHSLRRTVAFVCALTILSSAALVSAFAERKDEKAETAGEVVQHVDDYTNLFPGITSPKLKLSDPQFTEKDWYEYIEYEFYTEVKDGDITYRIYQPTDYGAASIMAITDYNPKEIFGGTNSLTMNIGELQGVLDIAAQGGSISKEYAGLDVATGIASKMNSINDVMDNSKYYSKSSFLGIPGDKKFTGVNNDGFYNANSLEIEITETEAVSVCKTVAIDSNYSISDTTENGKTKNSRVEVNDLISNTHEEQSYDEHSNTSGTVTVSGTNKTEDSYDLNTELENEIKKEWIHSINETIHGELVFHAGGMDVAKTETHLGADVENENKQEVVVVPKNQKQTGTVKSTETLDYTESNVEDTNMDGHSSSDSSTIEHALTSGEDNGVTYSHANEMAVDIGYGVNYQYGNDHSLSLGVKRVFNARDDKEVKNVGWKLCEYIVKVPYYIEAVKTDTDGLEKVLYGQYVNYNLLNGVCRVFANGYIEHWYTGELVTYADFFDGFITAKELVDKAQEQQKAKLPEEAK